MGTDKSTSAILGNMVQDISLEESTWVAQDTQVVNTEVEEVGTLVDLDTQEGDTLDRNTLQGVDPMQLFPRWLDSGLQCPVRLS